MEREDLTGALAAGAAKLLVSSSVAALSLIAAYPPFSSQALRYALATVALGLLLRIRRQPLVRLTWRETGFVLALALGIVGGNVSVLLALREADPALVGMVVGCIPLALAFAGPAVQRHAPSPRLVGAAVLVSLGIVAVNGAGTSTARGFVLSLGAFASEIVFALVAAALLRRLSSLLLAVYVCATASAFQAGAALAVDGSRALPPLAASQAVAIGYLGLVVTTGSFLASNVALARLGVERTGLFNGLAPLIVLLSAAAVGTSTVTPLRAMGAVLVAGGVILGLTAGGRAGHRRGCAPR